MLKLAFIKRPYYQSSKEKQNSKFKKILDQATDKALHFYEQSTALKMGIPPVISFSKKRKIDDMAIKEEGDLKRPKADPLNEETTPDTLAMIPSQSGVYLYEKEQPIADGEMTDADIFTLGEMATHPIPDASPKAESFIPLDFRIESDLISSYTNEELDYYFT
jgi:hypothetical protein